MKVSLDGRARPGHSGQVQRPGVPGRSGAAGTRQSVDEPVSEEITVNLAKILVFR